MKARIFLTAALVLAGASLQSGAFAPAPLRPRPGTTRLSCQGPRDDWADDVKLAVTAEQAVVAIAWGRGIGSATVTLESGEWPRRVRLEFRGFRNLASLLLYHGNLSLGTALGNGPRAGVGVRQKNGQYDHDSPDRPRFDVLVSRHGEKGKDGVIEVELPRDLLKRESTTLRIDWIDDFRK